MIFTLISKLTKVFNFCVVVVVVVVVVILGRGGSSVGRRGQGHSTEGADTGKVCMKICVKSTRCLYQQFRQGSILYM